jgi:integrase
MPKVKEPIKLRTKPISNGNKSIYLAIYRGGGKRDYEFLKLHLIPDKAPNAKELNAKTWELATKIKNQKTVELQNNVHGFVSGGSRSKMNLLDYVQHLADEKLKKAKGNKRTTQMNYVSLKYHLKQYAGTNTTFKHIDKAFCLGFLNYLKTAKSPIGKPLSENTQFTKLTIFSGILNYAIVDEIILNNPFKQIKREDKPKHNRSETVYLTPDEVKQLIKTPFPTHPQTRNAFLFSCLTGLRYSDVHNLTWEKLKKDSTGATVMHYVQKKTKAREYLQISSEALQFLPDKGTAKGTDLVFGIGTKSHNVNVQLRKWALLAGISKHLTFHIARHTSATLMLSLGVPIETVSKVLGHANLQTTQIYAKVVDKNKRDAVDKLGSFLGGLTD